MDLEEQNITTRVTQITTEKGGNEGVVRGEKDPEMDKDFAEKGVLRVKPKYSGLTKKVKQWKAS